MTRNGTTNRKEKKAKGTTKESMSKERNRKGKANKKKEQQ